MSTNLIFRRFLHRPINHKGIISNYSLNGIKNEINSIKKNDINIPLIINGKKIYKKDYFTQYCPYNKNINVCNYSNADENDICTAIESTKSAKKIWGNYSTNEKYKIFLNAAELVEGKYYDKIMASTIIGQGKNYYQAEIDAISELSDFLRFNVYYHQQLQNEQPFNSDNAKNRSRWIGLNGFVASITPFNFTAIGGNLATAPILMGNPVLWKPSPYSILSNYYFYEVLLEAGMPSEIVNFIPSDPNLFMNEILKSKYFSGLAFTGSSEVFDNILKKVYLNIDNYVSYPRIVGETGGNNFHFVFPDMKDNIDWVVESTIKGAYEFSGQKCSATSRIYIPDTLFSKFMSLFESKMKELKICSPEKDDCFTSSVIHENSYNKLKKYLIENKKDIIYGGNFNDKKGFYIEPTLIRINDLNDERWKDEHFGPILSVYVYNEKNIDEVMAVCNSITKYSLTGSFFTNNEQYINLIKNFFEYSAGNIYINDKSTGSIVGQQPFGGFKKSGTNDKAGSKYFLTRFGNNQVIKINENYSKIHLFENIIN